MTTTHNAKASTLLGIDLLGSPVQEVSETGPKRISYTPYGHTTDLLTEAMGFTGQKSELKLGKYLLGNGYRGYSPSLMRFTMADELSPFGQGGLNSYAYCGLDPVNSKDPSGRSWMSAFKGIANFFGRKSSAALAAQNSLLAKNISAIDGQILKGPISVKHEYYDNLLQKGLPKKFKPLKPENIQSAKVNYDPDFKTGGDLNLLLRSRGVYEEKFKTNFGILRSRNKAGNLSPEAVAFKNIEAQRYIVHKHPTKGTYASINIEAHRKGIRSTDYPLDKLNPIRRAELGIR